MQEQQAEAERRLTERERFWQDKVEELILWI